MNPTNPTAPAAPKLFISYAHADSDFLEEAHRHLLPLVRSGQLAMWADREIPAGSQWETEIRKALADADAGILLVSSNSLASEFITTTELPELLKKRVFWIPISASSYQHTELSAIQSLHDPKQPLDTLLPPQRNTAWVEICKKLLQALKKLPPPAHPPSKQGTSRRRLFGVPEPNPVFTGRDSELAELGEALRIGDAALTQSRTVAATALKGMGGVGKSHTAIEFAHNHSVRFEFVFWVEAETVGAFNSKLAALAWEVMPEIPAETDEATRTAAMRNWFSENGGWLLIVDNAEGLNEWTGVLPRHSSGRVLLTTREPVPATLAKKVEIETLDTDTGALLLLRRAGMLQDGGLSTAPEQDQKDARTVSERLGGLALALDQAGAYMGETNISPGDYLRDYELEGQALHRKYPGKQHDPVEVTFQMAMRKLAEITEVGPAAVELVTLCAFLAPEPIPEVVFTEGSDELGGVLGPLAAKTTSLRPVYAAASKLGLVSHETEPPALSMHRLVAEVVQSGLSMDEKREVAERVVNSVHAAFPEPEFETWPFCASLLPHALVCVKHIGEYVLETGEASRLLDRVGSYLREQGRYSDAEPLFRRALQIQRTVYKADHSNIVSGLNNLGLLLTFMGRYPEAAHLLEEQRAIEERTGRTEEYDHAVSLDNLGGVYYKMGRWDEAEPLFHKALDMTRKLLGSAHPEVARRLNNYGNLLGDLKRYEEAEGLLREALDISRKTIGERHPDQALRLMNLGGLYVDWQKPELARPLLVQALTMMEDLFGADHPAYAHCHYWLGRMHCEGGNLKEAAGAFRIAFDIRERWLGPDHPETIAARSWLESVERGE